MREKASPVEIEGGKIASLAVLKRLCGIKGIAAILGDFGAIEMASASAARETREEPITQ